MDNVIEMIDELRIEIVKLKKELGEYKQAYNSMYKDILMRTQQVRNLQEECNRLNVMLDRGVEDGK